jgi:alpha-galactosidase
MQNLAKKIFEKNLTPGIWLAPFILHPKADLVNKHPDWLLRNKQGKPVTAGFGWNAMTYALDLTNPDALAYACSVIHEAVSQWGYKYLKLDFLYAAALEGHYQDPTKTRAQVLRGGLEALRAAAGPDITMLACGCPLGSALGLFEAMRISADVSGHWEPHLPVLGALLKKEPGVPSAKNAIHNILTRAPLQHHWWVNDPDCLLIRPDSHLNLAEVQTLASVIGVTGGSLLLSDDLPALPEERLKIAQALLPLIDQRAQVIDWTKGGHPAYLKVDLTGPIGPWHLLAIINWEDHARSLSFSPISFNLSQKNTWWLREFWTGEIGQMTIEIPFTFKDVPAHGVRVVAVRPYLSAQPAYIGSDLHLSQGMEISQWHVNKNQLKINFDLGRSASGNIYLSIPWKNPSARINELEIPLNALGQSIYQIYLENLNIPDLEIRGN